MNDSRVGSQLGDYRIESLLGRGGMGVVYLAEHVRLKRKVALKILSGELTDNPAFRERFVRESELAASLDHPNIIPIYDAGESDGLAFIAMRYVGGSDLDAVIRTLGPQPLGRVVQIARQVGSALDAAHSRGLIHRDVKPGNILLVEGEHGDPDHAYLSDFGLTKRPGSDTGLTGTGQFIGSVDYMAPEQIEGKPIDGRSDIYSLGCVLFECLTGTKPFVRDSEVAALWAHVQAERPTATALNPELPGAIDAVLEKAMARSPDERFGTCRELSAAVGGALAEAPGAVGPRAPIWRSWRAVAGSLAVALTVVVAAIWLLNDKESPRSAAIRAGVIELDTEKGAPGDVMAVDGLGSAFVQSGVDRGGAGVHPRDTTSGNGKLWVGGDRGLWQLDPETGPTTLWVEMPAGVAQVAFGEDQVWALSGRAPPRDGPDGVSSEVTLYGIDPAAGQGRGIRWEQRISNAQVLAAGEGFGWVGSETKLLKIDPSNGNIVERWNISFNNNGNAIDVGEGSVWLTSLDTVKRIDPTSGTVRTVEVFDAGGISVGAGAVWVLNTDSSTESAKLIQINPETNRRLGTTELPTGAAADWVEAGERSVWVADGLNNKVYEVEPIGGRLVQTYSLGRNIRTIAIDGDRVWVSFY